MSSSSSSHSEGEETEGSVSYDTNEEEKVSEEVTSVRTDVSPITREKLDLPPAITSILKENTSWETMEDLIDATTDYNTSSKYDYEHVTGKLAEVEALSSLLVCYDHGLVGQYDSYIQVVHDTICEIVEQFPNIQSAEAFKQLPEGIRKRIVGTLEWKQRLKLTTKKRKRMSRKGKAESAATTAARDDSVTVEVLLEKLVKLVAEEEKVINWLDTMGKVRSRVGILIHTLKDAVVRASFRQGKERAAQAEEDRERVEDQKRAKRAARTLPVCKLIKEVLGARVADVVVCSQCHATWPSCFLRDSGNKGEMTMGINPEASIIKHLRRMTLSTADKNDVRVRDAVLGLYTFADMCRKRRGCAHAFQAHAGVYQGIESRLDWMESKVEQNLEQCLKSQAVGADDASGGTGWVFDGNGMCVHLEGIYACMREMQSHLGNMELMVDVERQPVMSPVVVDASDT